MYTCALVPVKGLAEAKGRLGAALAPETRSALALYLARRVVEAVRSSGLVSTVYVVTPDAGVAECAAGWGALALLDSGDGLNRALAEATVSLMDAGAEACLTVFGDLPLLGPDDVAGMFRLARESRCAVAAPDHHGKGTNALLLLPPDALPFAFGARSYSAHAAAAGRASVPFHAYEAAGTAFDLDTPDDLLLLRSHGFDLGAVLPEVVATGKGGRQVA